MISAWTDRSSSTSIATGPSSRSSGVSLGRTSRRAIPVPGISETRDRQTHGMKVRLSTDGGARGNPGPAAFAYVLEAEDGTVLAAHGEAIGVATNNVAEYRALVEGLRKAVEAGVTDLDVVSDSELMVKQMRGEYRVKNEALRTLSVEAGRLARALRPLPHTGVRPEHKQLADRLVNEALDA